MTRPVLVPVVALLAVTAGCRPQDTPEPLKSGSQSASTPDPVPSPVIVPGPESAAPELQAFQAAWGAPPPLRRAAPYTGRTNVEFIYEGGSLVPLGGDRYALVSTGRRNFASHADTAALSIHYLRRTATGFERTGAWPEFLADGTTGEPPTWTVRADLTAAPALLTEAGGVWQGYACTWSHLIELAPEGPVLRTDSIPVGYDSSGAKGDEGAELMDGVVRPGAKGRSFVIRYTGDRRTDVTYTLSGTKYEPTIKPDLLTC